METETSSRSRAFKILIIVLLVLAIVLLGVIGYFVVFDGESISLAGIFTSSENEHTYLLEEFTVNLKAEDNGRNYAKAQIALMYTDSDHENTLMVNTIKIRDIIINELRSLTSEELLDGDNTENIKTRIRESINIELGQDLVEDIYFSDLIVQ